MKSDCRHARLHIGGEPMLLPAEVLDHLTTCAKCSRFRDETLAMEIRLRGALELPLNRFRAPIAPRRFAMAASVVLAVLAGGGFWLLRPQPALAGDVIEHVIHEPDSWTRRQPLSADELSTVLQAAGVAFDAKMPVVYAAPCLFRGYRVPHLVVQTGQGPVTVMLLAHERVTAREEFSEGPYRGVLLPAGQGSIAVISREVGVSETVTQQLLSGLR